ncbi:serine/threonine-protein kinase, partial [Planctomycetota bacterium]
QEQVDEALRIQKRLHADGRRKKIGKIMVKLGFLTATQAKYILRLQRTPDPIHGYKLLERRGRGGMGVVYRAVQKSLKREVAVKILAPRFAAHARFLRRFFREAKLAGGLNHRNIVSAIDFGESNGLFYYAMEYVDGWSVAEMLREDGPLDTDEALDVTLQMAKALDHAAEQHVVHRDIKPENILVTPDGVAKLTDLGLSKQLTSDCSITTEGKTLGTPFYVSPELARGTRDVDMRSDIYSLGATLFHMLSGEPPFTGDNPASIMACHIADEPVPLRKRAPHVPRPVQKLVERMMEKDVDRRYQTADELIRDLVALRKGRNPFSVARGPAPDSSSGRFQALGARRAAAMIEDRERRSVKKVRPPSTVLPVVVIVALVVLLFTFLAVAISRNSGRSRGPTRRGGGAQDQHPSEVRNDPMTLALVAREQPKVERLLAEEKLKDAFERTTRLVEETRGTSAALRAEDLLRRVRHKVDEVAPSLKQSARAALRVGKAELALELLSDLPEIGGVAAIRAEAREKLGIRAPHRLHD